MSLLCPTLWAHLSAVPIAGQGLCPPHLLHFDLVGDELLGLVGEGLSGRQLGKAADLLHVPALRAGGAGHPGTHSVGTGVGATHHTDTKCTSRSSGSAMPHPRPAEGLSLSLFPHLLWA